MSEARKVHTALPPDIGLAEEYRQDWVVNVKADVHKDEVLDPAFWAHVAEMMKPFDTIEVRWEDGSLIRNLRVVWAQKGYARVHLVSDEELEKVNPDSEVKSMTYEVRWKGPVKRFAVIRRKDQKEIQDGFMDKAAANKWISDNE